MEITAATAVHVPEIVELWKEFMDFHRNCDPFFTRNKDAHKAFEEYVKEQITSKEAQVLVAVDSGHVISYSISQILKYPPIYLDETYGFISDIAVNSAYQRQGIGDAMLHRIFEWFRSRNIKRVELQVAAKNQVGYSFWRKNGFEDYIHVLYLKIEENGFKPDED